MSLASIATKLHNKLANLAWSTSGHTIDATVNMSGNILQGNTTSGGNLTLSSSGHATKGKILFGTSVYDEVNNRLGIGTNSPIVNFHVSDGNIPSSIFTTVADLGLVSKQNNSSVFRLAVASDISGGHRPSILGMRTRGTLAAPTPPLLNDYIYSILGAIYDGTTVQNVGEVSFIVDGVVSTGIAPMRISFQTSPTTSGGKVERLIVKSTGEIGIGTTTPLAFMHIKAGTATASTAPLKFTSGTNMTAAEAGAVEYNGTDLFLTSTSDVTRRRLSRSYSAIAPSAITVGASPFVYQNTTGYDISVLVSGGVVTALQFSRDNVTYYAVGFLGGMVWLSPNDYLKVTYTGLPVMDLIPR